MVKRWLCKIQESNVLNTEGNEKLFSKLGKTATEYYLFTDHTADFM